MKFASAFIQNRSNRKKLKLLFCLPVLLCLIPFPGNAATNSWELIPENPVVGDTIEIRGADFAGETADVWVSFEKDVRVSDGKYEYLLDDVRIPPGFNNRFTVQAIGVDDLNVRVKMILWITITGKAKEGNATVSQAGVPPGTYKIRLDGKSNASDVKLRITGFQQVKVDSGNFSYKYDTKSIPAGNFEIKVGDVAKQVTLQTAESRPSDMTLSSEQKEGQKEDLSRDWKASNIWIEGILAGMLLLLLYSRIKKR
ncbi:hypothetical protein EO98_12990 [Methanosarcina sp. 2.H.T.1A.6]|uniref:hypothetical protein n=1 Tax=unclassified Methanosarcina TaxID=2644672 RepID=UPI000621E6BD|nr:MULTISPECIES: hypothetical protein [unclassified Methanosarcina]KKG17390.1 hypothetical protein EO94_14590 [Methanosarcina sp. 2.H.T.1A.3]KKG24326.1 hypothetical protein EO98_12990 [Methanosarcina sp. 2.H.T.1A.6]KKG25687.1 hypothetical protein EO96_15405 [Methanosarcina sp. 2.H.T.1A.8]KKG28013.1 hypothetical protein EO97_18150 [Methanosarcina sp. 2.H.T.1A.15]